jgi:hypothetical protein
MTRRACIDEAGTVTAFVVGLVTALLLAAGLVVDGGRLVAARVEAADVAAGAARTGAQEMVGIRAGTPSLDAAAAVAAAEAFAAAAGHRAGAEVRDGRVVVAVSVTHRPVLLGLVGIGPRTVTAVRSARAIDGELP